MKKILKITGIILLGLILLAVGFGVYVYQTNDRIKAMVNNDESKLFYFPSKKIADLKGFDYKEIELEVEKDIKIYNYLFKPKMDTIFGRIFFIHGAGGNVPHYKSLIKTLVDNGFEVYAVDWRGFGKSNGMPNYKNVIRDTQKSFEDYKNRLGNTDEKILVYGISLGGQVAVKITLDNSKDIRALILDGSIYSAQQIAIDHTPTEFLKQQIRMHPENFNQDYVAFRDIAKIKNVPKLIIHSTKDKQVLFKYGKKLYDNAQQPKSFWKTDTKHIMTLVTYPKETIQKIKQLLK